MASLSVRKLEQEVYNKLRVRAAKHGVSMEEEVRQIISQVVNSPDSINDVFNKYFGEKRGIDLKLLSEKKPHDPMDF